ncbi:BRCA2, oligonucleotide/oligosaccharide-binding, domain 1-domain-containing protein, partial [Chytriomyces sp. MP71]
TAVWVSNHYRWIVWKLAGMVRSFPYLHETIWTPLYVVEQLLFRYEKEYAGGKRSCLKQIIEGDAPVELLMVLCVSRIIINGRDISSENLDSSYLALELTDGWYRLNAQIDEVLSKAIRKNSITIGQKLLIYGAQLLGSAGSSTPLEAGDSLQLRLFANSTRRERWHAKLGFQRQSRPFQLALGHVAVQGGPVALVDAIIMRKFELCFVETNVDGTKTTRNEAEEEVERMRRLVSRCISKDFVLNTFLPHSESTRMRVPANSDGAIQIGKWLVFPINSCL